MRYRSFPLNRIQTLPRPAHLSVLRLSLVTASLVCLVTAIAPAATIQSGTAPLPEGGTVIWSSYDTQGMSAREITIEQPGGETHNARWIIESGSLTRSRQVVLEVDHHRLELHERTDPAEWNRFFADLERTGTGKLFRTASAALPPRTPFLKEFQALTDALNRPPRPLLSYIDCYKDCCLIGIEDCKKTCGGVGGEFELACMAACTNSVWIGCSIGCIPSDPARPSAPNERGTPPRKEELQLP